MPGEQYVWDKVIWLKTKSEDNTVHGQDFAQGAGGSQAPLQEISGAGNERAGPHFVLAPLSFLVQTQSHGKRPYQPDLPRHP